MQLRRMVRRMLGAAVAALPMLVASPALAAITVINVIPNSQSGEAFEDSEPSLMVNPTNPNQAVIGDFQGNASVFNSPYYATPNGGSSFFQDDNRPHSDGTMAWSLDGSKAYIGRLGYNGSNWFISTRSSTNPAGGVPFGTTVNVFNEPAGPSNINVPDQPYLNVGRGLDPVSGQVKDRLYMGFNDLAQPGNATASVRVSTDGGVNWSTMLIERGNPTAGQDGPPIRIANTGNTVYAAFERWNNVIDSGTANGYRIQGDLVVVKDNAGGTGANKFMDLGALGSTAAANTNFVFTRQSNGGINRGDGDGDALVNGSSLGHERIGSDLTIAVNPKNANDVFVAYAETPVGGQIRLDLLESKDGGATWATKYQFAGNPNYKTAIPSLAVTDNGNVGLLYTAFNSQGSKSYLETHLLVSGDDFATSNDTLLSRMVDASAPQFFDPYIGDFETLRAVGNTFYGTFCSTNQADGVNGYFPSVVFQRDFTGSIDSGSFQLTDANGRPVGFSVDPYYFQAAVPEPASVTLMAMGSGLVWVLRRRLRTA